MKKFVVIVLIILQLNSSVSLATDDLYKQYQMRIVALKQIQKDVLQRRIPVYFDVTCKDTSISNKLQSLIASALRKKDNVKIVSKRDNAWFWLYVIAIKENRLRVAVTIIFGEDADVSFSKDYEKWSFSVFPQDLLRPNSFTLYLRSIDNLSELVSTVIDKFDVEAIEPLRRDIDSYLI